MNKYKPGTGFRVKLVGTTIDGVLADPANSLVTLALPGPSGTIADGARIIGSPVQDSTGNWHCDVAIPFTCPAGIGAYRWQSSGATAVNRVAEKPIEILPLDFS